MPPVSVSTDGSIGGVNSCVEGKEVLVDDATAPPSTEVEGKSCLEICVGDPLVARESGEAHPPGDCGRSERKSPRNRSRFLGFS